MSPFLLPWINLLLLSTPTVAALPAATNVSVPLRAHILEMESIQWRADLFDQLEYIGQGDCYTVWTADAATLKRLVAASVSCLPAGTVKGLAAGGKRVFYVASFKRKAQVSKGRTTALALNPVIGNVLDGVELDVKEFPAPGGTLADITITSSRIRTFQTAIRREEVWDGSTSKPFRNTFQIPDVLHETVNGRWLIPTGRAIVVGLHVHGQSTVPWSGEAFRDRVIVIDAGDVPAPTFVRPPQTPRVSWSHGLALIGWPTLLTGAFAACFFAGWFVRGGTHQVADRETTAAGLRTITEQAPVDVDGRVGSRRLPRVSDAMVLVAATAVACLLVHKSVGTLDPAEVLDALNHAPATTDWPALNVALLLGALGVILSAPLLVAGSATLAMIVLSMPAAERSQTLRNPGPLACFQVGFVVVLIAGLGLVQYLIDSDPDRIHEIVMNSSIYVSGLSGLGIAGCWITMAMMGSWRSEAFWIDRLGRLLGICWIVTLPFVLLILLKFIG
ncbi:hypothetical protein SAMN05444166_4109 [Singulisphaera sp. GP187]|uniref:hypothetical protein n=1 Tax=Singulisphaera sp. GP187 TaxID=1882752 RepID=UPI000927228C|nr:hypothetical protein [Singulisphaera sp. GP187]SIO36337.1 hypothetical protein SAMN05444166_4109 [Singulisphaera sp. GP187]